MIFKIIISICLIIICIYLIWSNSFYPIIYLWEWSNQYSSILAVLATIGLGLIAIYGERVRLWLFGPRLEILFDDKNLSLPYIKSAPMFISELVDDETIINNIPKKLPFVENSIWVRAQIINKGITTAKNCEPRLVKITQNGNLIKEFDPITLHWVGHPPKMKSRSETSLDIRPKAPPELIDLCFFSKKETIDLSSYRLKNITIIDLKEVKIHDTNPHPRANKVRLQRDSEICFTVCIVSENAVAKKTIKIKPSNFFNTKIL